MIAEINNPESVVHIEEAIKRLKDVYQREASQTKLLATVGQILDVLDGPGEKNEWWNEQLDQVIAMHRINEEALLKVYSKKARTDGPNNLPSLFKKLKPREQDALLRWLRLNMVAAKSPDPNHTSYGLKHSFKRDTGIYVYNGAFKGAMLVTGFKPHDIWDVNWFFNARYRPPKPRR